MRILRDLRTGAFDVLIGINLLREGLDLPEVATIAILDADKEGFLRSTTSLVQIIGRAARNLKGKVIMYADNVTDSMFRAIQETNRRRTIQSDFNQVNGIVPISVRKDVRDVLDTMEEAAEAAGLAREEADRILESGRVPNELARLQPKALEKMAAKLDKSMKEAARKLEFEEAARIRDLLVIVRGHLPT
jgi:excinuclease ABC subunit B